jgi:hypothetical protein
VSNYYHSGGSGSGGGGGWARRGNGASDGVSRGATVLTGDTAPALASLSAAVVALNLTDCSGLTDADLIAVAKRCGPRLEHLNISG